MKALTQVVTLSATFRSETRCLFPKMEFHGAIKDVGKLREFYQMLDYVIVPSVSESFGLVSMEAQFCGTPVVCYDVGGLPETILDMATGLVVRPRTPAALAEGILKMHHQGVLLRLDPDCKPVREHLGKYRLDAINSKYAEIYSSLF